MYRLATIQAIADNNFSVDNMRSSLDHIGDHLPMLILMIKLEIIDPKEYISYMEERVKR